MTGKTHIIGGVLTEAIILNTVASVTSPKTLAALLAVSGMAALVPDIDIPTSTIGKPLKLLSVPINKLCGHRGLFHAPLLYLVLWIAAWIASCHSIFVNAAFIGIFSHLILDTLNPSGIPWLYPFSKEKQHIAKIHTGSIGDSITALSMIVGTLYILSLMYGFGGFSF